MSRRALLQLAVDALSTEEAVSIASRVYPHLDIVEAGTPLILSEGLAALAALRAACPGKRVLADLKIMDAGRLEAGMAFRRGADIVTVLGAADDTTIGGALAAAAEAGGEIMADLINVRDPAVRARELAALGVRVLCVHTAHDLTEGGDSPLAELTAVRAVTGARLAVAGGLDRVSAREAVARGADVIVVGTAVTCHAEPDRAAREILEAMGR